MRKFDIGVMPLPDTEWSRGKCALKLLQYMSSGVPAISSSRGSATEIVADGDNGFLADSHDQWVRRLKELLRDQRLRKKIGDNGRDWVVNHYNLSIYGPLLGRYLRAVVEGKRVQDA